MVSAKIVPQTASASGSKKTRIKPLIASIAAPSCSIAPPATAKRRCPHNTVRESQDRGSTQISASVRALEKLVSSACHLGIETAHSLRRPIKEKRPTTLHRELRYSERCQSKRSH